MCNRGYKRLFKIDLGRSQYKKAWDMQKKLVNMRFANKIPDTIIITEHQPVITMGRGTDKKNLLCTPEKLKEKGIDLFEIERGGDITFHGPGQIVVYPIINLNERGRDVHKYLRELENFAIEALGDLDLEAETKEGLTGIWVNDHKIGAIGVAVTKWITYHGLALNINTDLDYFKFINPCGITEYPVGSIEKLLGRKTDLKTVSGILIKKFAEIFNYEIEIVHDTDAIIKPN